MKSEAEDEAGRTGIDLGPLCGNVGYTLRRAQLKIHEDFLRRLEGLQLRPAYFSALVIIDENPGHNQSEVSASLGIQRTNFVAMVDELEERGLAERMPAAGDRRSYALYLTRKGKRLVGKARELQAEHERELAEKLGEDGREQLLALLGKLIG